MTISQCVDSNNRRVIFTVIASAMFLANGVDHCRAGDDAHRVPCRTTGLEHANIFAPALMLISGLYQHVNILEIEIMADGLGMQDMIDDAYYSQRSAI